MARVCRGVACLLVLLLHGGGLVARRYEVKPLFGLTEFGFSGVHMFFVISGLIIYHAHHRELGEPRNTRNFVLKRLVRIYPFYWIVFFLLGGRKVLIHRIEISDFLTNALFFSSSKSLIVSVSWTLAYEMIFYGMFVAFFFSRRLGLAVFAAWFGLTAFNFHDRFSTSIPFHLLNVLFAFGLLTSVSLIALRSRLDPKRRDWIGIASLIAGTLLFSGTAWYYLAFCDRSLYVWESLPLTVGFGTGSALLLLASASARVEAFLKRRRLLLLIGDASYSIYLLHSYFQKRTVALLRSLDWPAPGETGHVTAFLLLALLAVVSVGFGILAHRLVEKPMLGWFRRSLKLGGSAQTALSGGASEEAAGPRAAKAPR